MSRNTADTTAILGASGTGKGVYAKERVRPHLRRRPVFVWSPLEVTDHYAQVFNGSLVNTIPALCSHARTKAPVAVFVPSSDHKVMRGQFDLFCRVVWNVPGCVALVEELSRVTSPSYAPAPWRDLSTAGRHQGITLLGTAQRPAQIDKDFLGNCTEIRAYRVGYENDAKSVAGSMREPWATFMELPDLHYVHRYVRELRNVRGVQALPAGRDAPAAAAARSVTKKPARSRG